MKLIPSTAIAATLTLAAAIASANDVNTIAYPDSTITQSINKAGTITVTHPAALEARLRKLTVQEDSVATAEPEKKTGRVKKLGGYRVQIYSDNNAHTAKNAARAKERAILGVYPDLATYVIYESPYWRLRVGDCRTRAEAEELASELKKAFPAYRAEITVVRDRINAVNQ